MNFDNFNTLVDECRAKKPILFGLEHDKILCAEEIEQLEKTVHIALPEKYKEFIMNYGGGYFGYANIYSLDIDSNFYLLKHNNLPFEKFIRIALHKLCIRLHLGYLFYLFRGTSCNCFPRIQIKHDIILIFFLTKKTHMHLFSA